MINNKVLFISHDPFSEIGNNGKTYLSLFADFKDEEVAQLYFNKLMPSTYKFSKFFRITDLDALKCFFLRKTNKFSGEVKREKIESIEARSIKRSQFRVEIVKLVRNFLYSIVRVGDIQAFKIWVESFKPTVIFCSGTNYLFIYKVLKQISVRYNIPYFIYFTDDYFIYNNGTNFFSKILHKRFVSKAKKIVEGAEELFVISPKMKTEYEDFFGKKCSVLINAVDSRIIPEPKIKLENPILFRYFGWLHSDRASSIGYLGVCLNYLNEHHGMNCKLEVYTLSIPQEKTKKDLEVNTINICKPLIGDELKEKIVSSDFLVHSESFQPADMQVTMLSISTKIPEYLLSNRCIIAVGPPNLASINVLESNNLGIVLSDKNLFIENCQKLLNVINDINTYNSYCTRSQVFCKSEFNSVLMKSLLRHKLFSL